jgi:hypothetical protein
VYQLPRSEIILADMADGYTKTLEGRVGTLEEGRGFAHRRPIILFGALRCAFRHDRGILCRAFHPAIVFARRPRGFQR